MWEQIRSNRIRSAVLVAALGSLLLLFGYSLGVYFLDSGTAGLVVALAVYAIMNLVTFLQGDSILLALSGARRIRPEDHPRLYNVVEEMKIASGLPKIPDVYIIDDPALNAFATGRDPGRASVAITSGLLERLNRDQLQGVIGHEIAHVKNRDILLMTVASVLLGSIVILSSYASRVFLYGGTGRSRRRSYSGGGNTAQLVLIAVAILLVIVAPIIARLIYFAISRRREYLADASGALYTRYPEGLASALEKLATLNTRVRNANRATAPMYTADPFQKTAAAASDLTINGTTWRIEQHEKAAAAGDLMSSHPPIAERVRILRAMGGAAYADYDKAYRQVRGVAASSRHRPWPVPARLRCGPPCRKRPWGQIARADWSGRGRPPTSCGGSATTAP